MLNNNPREAALGGKAYRVSALKEREWGAVQAWIKDHVPGPLALVDDAALDGLSAAHRQEMIRVAMQEARNWPPRILSEAWWDAIDHPGGRELFLRTVLLKHQDVPDAEILALAEDGFVRSEFLGLVFILLGVEDPRPKAGGGEDEDTTPTAPPPPPTTEAPTTSGSSISSSPGTSATRSSRSAT